MKYKIFAGTCLVLIGLFAALSMYYKKEQAKMYDFMAQHNASTFIREHSQTLGAEDAKVFLVEFMDPACETCAAFSPFVRQMMAASPGQIKLVVRYAPFHEGAEYYIKILEAAKKQGKYWETLDLMFKSQPFWTRNHVALPDKIWPFLEQLELNLDQIRKDMNDPEIEKIIAQDLADAQALNVRKTPGYFVNGKPLVTFGRQNLYDLIQSEIKIQY